MTVFVKKLNKLSILIGVSGFLVSLYALFVHVKTLMGPGGGTLCDVSATINCSAVIGSRYGEFAAIPLGAYGMAYFAIILAAAVTPKLSHITAKQLLKLELSIALVGLAVVGALAVISYTILKMVCPTCSIIHVLVVIYTILKIVQFIKLRKERISESHSDVSHMTTEPYVRFFGLALCLAIPPLMVGLMSPLLVSYLGKSNPSHNLTENSLQPLTDSQITLQKEMMKFNKSNYVGNGEDYRRGNDNAPVVVQVFADFGCPHCKVIGEVLKKAQDTVGLDKVVIVDRFYPLSNECNSFVGAKGWYEYNCSLVIASRCAGQQGQFLAFKEWAFSGQDWTNQERAQKFSLAGLQKEAQALNINVNTFAQCIGGHGEDQKIKDDTVLANQLGIQGTPLILIDGMVYKGYPDALNLVKAFEQALAK
jgi:protein-disulfide isomerase/uncharacterized membrane protein